MVRTIKVAKIGEKARDIVVDGAITFRGLIKLAGFSGSEMVFIEGRGAVILDEPVAETVTAVVVSMPKIAGGALPANLRVVDENGTEWRPVAVEDDEDGEEEDDDDDWFDDADEVSDDEDDEVIDDAVIRTIKVGQIGKPYASVEVVGAITYRGLLKLAGYDGSEAIFAEGRGPVILDEPVHDTVQLVVVNMPKIAGGFHL